MWIFCCGMQRSGSTLQFQITARLVEEAGLGQRVEWVKPDRFPQLRQKYAEYPGWKVSKSHICTDDMAAEFHRHNAMGVYVFRDPRDVFVSTMRKYAASFDVLWGSGFLEECLYHFHRWTSLPRVLVQSYEQMISDLPGEVERIAAHLEIPVDRQNCEQIAAEYTIERQRERIEEAKRTGNLQQESARGPRFDPYTNLHTDHIQSGEIGGWKGILSAQQVALIEDQARDWLLSHGYALTQSSWQRTWLTFRHQQKMKAQRVRRRLGKRLARLRRQPGL
jgi:hypothetical protein